MAKMNSSRSSSRAQQVLLFALAFVLAVPVFAFADVTVSSVVTKDFDKNGHINILEVTFSGSGASADAADYVIGDGYAVDPDKGITVNGSVATVNIVEKAAYDTAATPSVVYQGGSPVTASDGAAPVFVSATGDDIGNLNVFNAVGDIVWLRFSEKVALFNAGQQVPAQSPADKHLALEQAIVIGGPCADGNGLQRVDKTNGNNFPTASPLDTEGLSDPIQEYFGTAVLPEGHDVITVKQMDGNSGSNSNSPSMVMVVYPEGATPPTGKCTAQIASGQNTIFGKGSDGKWTVPAVTSGLGAAKITHIRPVPADVPTTASVSHIGQIDQISITFKQSIDTSSVTNAILSRFTISDGTTAVPTSDLALPATPVSGQNKVLTINFTPPTGWNTGTTPTVAYSDAGSCLVDGIRIVTLTTYTECAAGFSVTALDRAAPVLLGARTIDADKNGRLDRIRLQFSELIDTASLPGSEAEFTVAGYTVGGAPTTPSGADDASVDVPLAENAPNGDTDATPAVTYTPTAAMKDTATPGIAVAGFANVVPVDGAGPAIISGSVYDVLTGATANQHDGTIDEAVFTFSEPVNDASLVTSKFHIGTDAANVFRTSSTNTEDTDVVNDKVVTVAVANGVAGTDALDLSVDAGAVSDLASVAVAAPATLLAAATVADHAAPMIMAVTPTGQSTNAATVAVRYSEPMDTNQSIAVQYSGPSLGAPVAIPASGDVGHNNGWRTDNAAVWEGVAPAPDFDTCDAVAGCAFTLTISGGKGEDGNNQAIPSDTRFPWTIDTTAPQAPAITAPGPGSSQVTPGSARDVVITGTASETGLVIRIVEGDTVVTTTSSAASGHTWSATIPDRGLGSHTITVTAVDAGTNTSPPVTRQFFVKQAVSLTMTRSRSSLVYGTPLTLSGVLKNSAGQGMGGSQVIIQGATFGTSTWRNLVGLTTNSSGAYSWTFRPSASTTYRAVYVGTSTINGMTTPSAPTSVLVAITAGQSASKIRLGQAAALYGSIRPGHAGKIMKLQVLRSTGWTSVAYVKLDSSSNYRFIVKPSARGTYKYRLYYQRQDGEHFDNYTYRVLYVV